MLLWLTKEDEFENREKNVWEVFSENLENGDSDIGHKFNRFLPQYSSLIFMLPIKFLIEELEIVMAEENNTEYWANWIEIAFYLDFSECQDSDAGNTNQQWSQERTLYN